MQAKTSATSEPMAAATPCRRVLVVDDSAAQRIVLRLQLSRWGYAVTEAASGDEALLLCRAQDFDIILSDWVMPGMAGVDFCRHLRAMARDRYAYFILLTSKADKAEVADGLDAGADDFLTKPVNPEELRARLRAGERIISMQEELVEKNRLIGESLTEIRRLYDALDRDLIEARKLQQTLVRERLFDFGTGRVSLMLHPSGHVGGDLPGCFRLDDRKVALFSLDVSGHGVASAMMTARLSGLLSAAAPDQNLAFKRGPDGTPVILAPDEVADRLNRTLIEDLQVDQYLTMVYAEADLDTGHISLVQGGHPPPVLLRAGGGIDFLGQGGFPIGLLAEARFDRVEARLDPGDRLLLISDGLTECPDDAGAELGLDGLRQVLADHQGLPSPQLLETLVWRLHARLGGSDFPDDVSALCFDFLGPQGGA